MLILNLVCRGIENRGIAERLGLAEATVKIYVQGVLRKLKLHNRTEAVARAFFNDGELVTRANRRWLRSTGEPPLEYYVRRRSPGTF